ncbi:translation initiation factor IF-2 [Patescibacteria group bacterium]|nr:translation initiation factor IF-2 [Patescibacteria group bacterium]MBU4162289.1 translation initiation factor IF-2 [Patescibacteria group bacterium]
MKKSKKDNLKERAPIVVVIGHVDHGKSSLLEAIKDFRITQKESGGITQHIGAYELEHKGKNITFIDTPGHEAFCAMRSRGANVADMAVLVVAAEEGVKPQTKEAINCIQETGIQVIVAINKIDKPEANPQKVKGELAKAGIVTEDMGGNIPCVLTSATQKIGIDDLLEMILLLAEMHEIKARYEKPAEGVIIETYLDDKRGCMATLLVKDGILEAQDIVATPSAIGKIKNMEDFQGNNLKQAIPSQPVSVLGFETVPFVGEIFKTFPDIEKAREYVIKEGREKQQNCIQTEEGHKFLNIILKTDVTGSLDAIEGMIRAIPQNEMAVHILKSGADTITEDDVQTAVSGKAKIFAFRIKANPNAIRLADQKKVTILHYDVIYELIQNLRRLMKQEAEQEIVRRDIGKMQILKVFMTEKDSQIVGGRVVEGEIIKNSKLEIYRNNELIGKGTISGIQKEKKSAERGVLDDEIGILYRGTTKIEEDDILSFFVEEKKQVDI